MLYILRNYSRPQKWNGLRKDCHCQHQWARVRGLALHLSPESPPTGILAFLRLTKLWGIFSVSRQWTAFQAWMDFDPPESACEQGNTSCSSSPPPGQFVFTGVLTPSSTWAQSHMLQETERWTVLSAAMHLCYQEGHSKAKLVVGFFIF